LAEARAGASERYVRLVGGDLVSSAITDTKTMRIENLRRVSRPKMHWHFRQRELTLFWFRRGCDSLRATIDGRSVEYSFSNKSNLAIFPAGSEIQGEWVVGPSLDYTVVFIDPDFVRDRLKTEIESPVVAFCHDQLTRGLGELCREAATPDNVFDLFAEGWGNQALAHMARVTRIAPPNKGVARGGLSPRSLRELEDYVRANLGLPISLSDLCSIAGLSKRHFLRAFQESVGATPHRYVLALRIEEAKRRLSETDDSVTAVALASGFSHSQHFANSFRTATGMTPSAFRQRFLV
jgi:AraC family transcriptional regulator